MTRGRSIPAISIVLLVSASAVLLAGCDSAIYQSPGGIRLNGDHVEFAVCEEIAGAEILVFGVERHGQPDVNYMQGAGEVRLTPEAPLSSAKVPDGVDAKTWDDPVVTPGARVSLFVYDEQGDVEFPIEFDIPESGLSDSLWTRSDGRQTAEACDAR